MEELLLKSIATVGIPGAICFFLLMNFSKKIENLTEAIRDVVSQFEHYNNQIDGRFKEAEYRLKRIEDEMDGISSRKSRGFKKSSEEKS